jgi:hypothetical protein
MIQPGVDYVSSPPADRKKSNRKARGGIVGGAGPLMVAPRPISATVESLLRQRLGGQGETSKCGSHGMVMAVGLLSSASAI